MTPPVLELKGLAQLLWAVKRWCQASSISLTFDETASQMGVCLGSSEPLQNMTALKIRAPFLSSVQDKMALTQGGISVTGALMRTFWHSSRLSTLSLNAQFLTVLPPSLVQLQDLTLRMFPTPIMLEETFSALEQLTNLTSLTLLELQMDRELKVPGLSLAGLPLRKLALRRAIPSSLTIPDGCMLDVTELGRANALQICEQHKEAVNLYTYKKMVAMKEVPAFIPSASNLKILNLECSSFGSSEAPLEVLELMKLQILSLSATDVHVELGDLPSLSRLTLSSKNVLNVTLEELPEDVAGKLKKFSFSYKIVQGYGLMSLLQSLASKGSQWDAATDGPMTTISPKAS